MSHVNLTAGVLPTTADDDPTLMKEDPSSVRLPALDDFLIDNQSEAAGSTCYVEEPVLEHAAIVHKSRDGKRQGTLF